MSRANHKLVRERMNEKRSKITDKQFFTSRLLAGHFEDIADAQTKRYHYNRRAVGVQRGYITCWRSHSKRQSWDRCRWLL